MKYFIIAGEASGDLHGSRLIAELKHRDSDAQFCFLGGDKMSEAANCTPVVHYRDMAFMGFVNVLLNINKIYHLRKVAQRELLRFQPDKVILIDYPGFNLRFAKFVKQNMPSVEVIYYIAPKLWAWKEYRIKSIKRYVDRMFTIFPFETEWFGSRGYKVEYVGNPSVDSVAAFMREEFDETRFRADNELDGRPIVALLPGSRRQEIRSCLPIMAQLATLYPDYQFVVAAAPSIESEFYKSVVGDNAVKILYGATYSLLRVARAAVVNSGTATLETALFRVPQVVVYKVFGGRLAMLLKPLLIKTPWVSLVNIIAQREAVTELLAHNFTLESTKTELDKIVVDGERREEMVRAYDEIIGMLGEAGADVRCAERICMG
ncbi:MAG: lipid-A-disaccharide synthase [Paludibacteraceae bacterium]|nr:lipid-A-disaccharide synthase [Paludibacteraceae bacterium]